MFALPRTFTRRLDGVAVALSGACYVHCLLLPIIAAFLPVLSDSHHHGWVHWTFVAIAIPTSILALLHGHQSVGVTVVLRLLAAFGLSLLILAALGWPSHELETVLTISGGTVLGGVHLFNYFHGRKKSGCPSHKSAA